MRRLILLPSMALLLAWSEGAQAQAARDSGAGGAAGGLCYRARPRLACSAFVLTNFGSYVVLGGGESGSGTPLRAVADWGLMVNVSPRDAIGGSIFLSAELQGVGLGPALRYRRWLSSSASVEVAVGTPLTNFGGPSGMGTGSVLGLVKWSPNHWFAVAARPELIRRPETEDCFMASVPGLSSGPVSCSSEVQPRVRLSLGVETGWVPGLVLTGASGLAFLMAMA